jgi:hypothetical protein
VIYHCPYQWSAYVYPYTTPFISACCVSLKYGRARMQPAVNGMGTMNLNNMDIMNRMVMGPSNYCLPYQCWLPLRLWHPPTPTSSRLEYSALRCHIEVVVGRRIWWRGIRVGFAFPTALQQSSHCKDSCVVQHSDLEWSICWP